MDRIEYVIENDFEKIINKNKKYKLSQINHKLDKIEYDSFFFLDHD